LQANTAIEEQFINYYKQLDTSTQREIAEKLYQIIWAKTIPLNTQNPSDNPFLSFIKKL